MEFMKNWKETTLGEIAEIKGGKRLPLGSSLQKEKNNHPYIKIANISNNQVGIIDEYVPDDVFEVIKRYIVNGGDVILSIVGTIGLIAKIPNSLHHANLTENCVKILPNRNILDDDYLYYFLISRIGQSEITSNTVGAVQPKLPIYGVQNIRISLPPIPEQKQIVAVLLNLDDKIGLLRAENETLEKIAQGIFKEWFVDFRIGGKKLKLNNGVPEGWRSGKLGDILSLEYGKALKEGNRSGSGFPVYGSNGVVGHNDEFLVKGDGIVVGRKGSMGTVLWVENNFYPIDTAFYVRDKIGVEKLFFHYLLLSKQDFEKVGSDSAVPGLNRNSAYCLEMIIPETVIINKFNEIIEPVFSKKKLNNSQIQALSRLRDTLLPKLMGGEMRVEG